MAAPERPWAAPGTSWGRLLGAFLGLSGQVLGRLGGFWAAPGGLLGRSGRLLGQSRTHCKKKTYVLRDFGPPGPVLAASGEQVKSKSRLSRLLLISTSIYACM